MENGTFGAYLDDKVKKNDEVVKSTSDMGV